MGNNNNKNKNTDKLVKEYQLSKDEKKLIIDIFKAQSENGQVKKETWLSIVQDHGVTAGLADSIWEAFKAGDSTMDIDDFIKMLGVCIGGTPEQKLSVSFDLFDVDRSNFLTPAGVSQVLEQCYVYELSRLKEPATDANTDKKQIEQLVKLIFEELDTDKDGKISRDEFMQGVPKNPCICKIMNKF